MLTRRQLIAAVDRSELGRSVKRRIAHRFKGSGLTAWATTVDGDRLHVDLANAVGRTIWYRGHYDDDLVRFVTSELGPGDAFLDVGANVGYYTAVAARRVGPEGLVIAVEPSPVVASLLASSIGRNRWGNVVLLTTAASDEPQLLRFDARANSGHSRLDPSGSRAVAAARLDDLVMPLLQDRPLRALKVDVEGHELPAFRGARRLLEVCGPARILSEAHPNDGLEASRGLFQEITQHGYSAVDPSTLAPVGPEDVSRHLWNVGFLKAA